MPSVHDFRADFRRGRTGNGLRINQKAGAYVASLFDADNFMVTSTGNAVRRWPTEIKDNLTAETRLEGLDLGSSNTSQFILAFSDARLDIYRLDDLSAPHQTILSAPWTDTTKWFMSLTRENTIVAITDETFKTQLLEFDTVAGTFSLNGFAFDDNENSTRLRAPFYDFATDTLRLTPTIFTSKGTSSVFAAGIETALGLVPADFDLALGTGKISANEDFFDASHAGTRMRVGSGEFEITSVTDAQNALIEVKRDIATQLDVDPFFITRNGTTVEVAAENHGLSVGDAVYFYGLSSEATDYAKDVLRGAANSLGSSLDADKTYSVSRVIDSGNFEIVGDAAVNQVTGLYGGSSVYMIASSGFANPTEPAFSDVRGWPQTGAFHEGRLWLGGTTSLPDALWGSAPFSTRDFDTGTGEPSDAIASYGIGDQSRLRHIVSSFDLLLFCENGEYYIPGSTDQIIVQETARARDATKHGASFTKPQVFDGAVFFIDKTGNNVREMQIQSAEQGYYAPPASVVVPDWIAKPQHVCQYSGSPEDSTPYVIYGKDEAGALVVMHSSRNDNAFGFMRWTLKNGSFQSAAEVGQRLFVSASRGADNFLMEFRTDAFAEMDFAEELTDTQATAWTSSWFTTETMQLTSERQVYSDATIDGAGAFTTPEALDVIQIGDAMPYLAEFNAPVSGSGQGPKVGKMQRLVSAEVSWISTESGFVDATSEFGNAGKQTILTALDNPSFQAPTPVDEWREYTIGAWGREPRMTISGETPGKIGMRGVVLNVYF